MLEDIINTQLEFKFNSPMQVNLKVVFITTAILVSDCSTLIHPSLAKHEDAFSSQVYQCDDYEFSIYSDLDKVTLYLTEGTVTLNRVRSASGAKYQNANLIFWNKGDRALLETAETTYSCQHNPQKESRHRRGKKSGISSHW
jgi:membrane-bound inhibitor of C-type lysozyme